MSGNRQSRVSTQGVVVAFEPALRRRHEREQYFRLYGQWTNDYRDGIDGLWAGPRDAEIIALPRKLHAFGS